MPAREQESARSTPRENRDRERGINNPLLFRSPSFSSSRGLQSLFQYRWQPYMVPYRRLLQSSLFVPLGHQLQLLPLGKTQQQKLKSQGLSLIELTWRLSKVINILFDYSLRSLFQSRNGSTGQWAAAWALSDQSGAILYGNCTRETGQLLGLIRKQMNTTSPSQNEYLTQWELHN